jgi:hypothetical protein
LAQVVAPAIRLPATMIMMAFVLISVTQAIMIMKTRPPLPRNSVDGRSASPPG